MNNTCLKLLIVFTFFLASCSEDFYSYYPTYEAAIKDGSLERGWLPKIIPSSSSEIHEQHNIDSNEVWISFNLPASEKEKITNNLKKLRHKEIVQIKLLLPYKRAKWWFEGLIQQTPANDNALNAEIFTLPCNIESSKAYLAFDRTGSKVYYWCTY